MKRSVNQLTYEIIGSAIEIHKTLGPGLLESAYRRCLWRELNLRGIYCRTEYPLDLDYKGLRVACAYKVDLLVDRRVAVECKSIAALAPIHEAQLLTYLRLGGWRVGLLINFNVEVLKNGIHRKILGYDH